MRRLLVTLLMLSGSLAHGASQDDDFLAAREAFRVGGASKLEGYAKRLNGHLLEPYLTYWQLSLRLERAAADEVRAFLVAHRDSPLSESLRADWLKVLGKNERWELFEQELPLLLGDDIEVTCYALQSRARLNASEALREARPLWFVTRELPESCTPLFHALAASGQLSPDDVWTRIRLALEAGRVSRARRVAGYLPAGQAPEPRVLETIASNPAGFLERQKFNLKGRAGREAVMFAAHRLARSSPPQAARHWAKLEERFAPEDRAYVWGLIGYLGAMHHDPNALAWYARAVDLSDLQLAWKARAALRARAWDEVLAAVEAMTEKEASEPAWRYWRARALKELGRAEDAEQILKPLATEFNFYGQLALEELGGKIATPPAAYKPGTEDVGDVNQRIGIRRALELYRLGLRPEANREWVWAIRDFDDKQLLAAAEVARRYEVYDRAINTADRTTELHDFGLRYLAPYRDVLTSHAARLALDEAWVYGLIRQESRFIPDARSRAGASGLMQLMPGTARWVARKLGLKNWRWSKVNEVDTNISLGTYYLRHVLDTLDGHPVLASAAYNAGPGRARAWRPEATIEGAVYAETIPLSETRDYVKKVMANTTYYAHTFSEQLQSLKQRLGVIGPRRIETEAPLDDLP
ncbi:MAG: lytic transglycosylase domain-containing protein [Betaproteobacteria bacterium]|nr:lytic transglycosylase domain-containing protein [Betaproteobacteria bacterium]